MKKLIITLLFAFVFSATQAAQSEAFSDVEKGAYYEDAVQWAVDEGIVSGFPDGTFRPAQKVTFNQFIKMYTNSYDFKANGANTYDEFYEVLEQYNLVFDPYKTKGDITRGDVSVLLAYVAGTLPEYERYADLQQYYEKGAEYMLATKLSTGQNAGKDITKVYGSTNTLTRGQAVTFLYRAAQNDLTTLADGIRYLVEPPVFDQHDDVLRSYNMGDGIVYYVMNHENATSNYEVVVTVNDKVLGGYIAIPGVNAFGYTIGEQHKEDYAFSYFNITPHIDKHNNNEVRAVSYRYKNIHYADVTSNAMKLHNVQAIDQVAQLYADLANEFRAKNGQKPLQTHDVLTKAAKGHSVDMATRDYFNHDTPEGLSPGDRIDAIEEISDLYGWGENIAAGRNSVFESHTAWINSLGHRENMLNQRYTHIGYGVGVSDDSTYGTYYTTKFGTIWE